MFELVDILMSVYNGKCYLHDQIDSISNQSYKKLKLTVRDDGSSDGSCDVVKRYVDSDLSIKLLHDNLPSLGPCLSFGELLKHSDAEYIMLCDQDDFWHPNKVEVTLSAIKELENQHSKKTPILIHSDLIVTDNKLSVLHDSFWKYQNVNPEKSKRLSRLLVRSMIRGCTIMINRALRDLCLPIPKEAIMHDHWISLVASAFGKIGYVRTPTMLYRLHNANTTQSRKWNIRYVLDKIISQEGRREMHDYLLRTQLQASAFADMYMEKLHIRDYRMVRTYADMKLQNFFEKRGNLIRYGLYNQGFIRNIGMILFI